MGRRLQLLRDKIILARSLEVLVRGSEKEEKATYFCMDAWVDQHGFVPGVVDVVAATSGSVVVALGKVVAAPF